MFNATKTRAALERLPNRENLLTELERLGDWYERSSISKHDGNTLRGADAVKYLPLMQLLLNDDLRSCLVSPTDVTLFRVLHLTAAPPTFPLTVNLRPSSTLLQAWSDDVDLALTGLDYKHSAEKGVLALVASQFSPSEMLMTPDAVHKLLSAARRIFTSDSEQERIEAVRQQVTAARWQHEYICLVPGKRRMQILDLSYRFNTKKGIRHLWRVAQRDRIAKVKLHGGKRIPIKSLPSCENRLVIQ